MANAERVPCLLANLEGLENRILDLRLYAFQLSHSDLLLGGAFPRVSSQRPETDICFDWLSWMMTSDEDVSGLRRRVLQKAGAEHFG